MTDREIALKDKFAFDTEIRLGKALTELKVAYDKGWQEGWKNAIIPWQAAESVLQKELAEKTEALESIEAFFCACSIDDEIIPQVVAREVLAKYKGDK